MHAEKLMKVVEKLRSLPPGRFRFSTWVDSTWRGLADLSCGAPACALGGATTLFPEEIVLVRNIDEHFDIAVALVGSEEAEGVFRWSSNRISIDSAAKVFGITYIEACWLFMPDTICPTELYPKAKDRHFSPGTGASAGRVADHIEGFIKLKQAA